MMPDIRKLVAMDILHSSLSAVSRAVDAASSGASTHLDLKVSVVGAFSYVLDISSDM